jgi:hypothetical protein
MAALRRIEPEWLDELSADDPRAIRSRRDLRRVNLWMLQASIVERMLSRLQGDDSPRSLIELGGGDGTFMLRLARRLSKRWPHVSVTLVDRQNIVSDATKLAFAGLGWELEVVTADVFDFLERNPSERVEVVTANLFLHHFSATQLAALFSRIAERTSLFVGCEPRRSALALGGSRMLWAIGCNDVSRHDAVVSVRAGFSGMELSALWPPDLGWQLVERPAGPFSHVFAAHRGTR